MNDLIANNIINKTKQLRYFLQYIKDFKYNKFIISQSL